tara:strand:- start:503 stop:700 length:198 start_codon:yes stop_codon:yes gene_type:complete
MVMKKYTIYNETTGSAMQMAFDSIDQLKQWLEINPDFKNLGVIDYDLPTRHVRMKNKEEFAGWGS